MVSSINSTNSLDYWYQLQEAAKQSGSLSASDVFSALDTNGDKTISEDEFLAGSSQTETGFMNQVMGSQSDSTSSLLTLLQGLEDLISGFEKVSDAVSSYSQESSPSADEFLGRADTNGDGVVSAEEFANAAPKDQALLGNGPSSTEIFNKIDTDGDGVLSAAELEADQEARETQSGNFAATLTNDISSFLANLLQGTQSDNGASTSTETGLSGVTSLLFQALDKYLQFGEAGQTTATTGSSSVTA